MTCMTQYPYSNHESPSSLLHQAVLVYTCPLFIRSALSLTPLFYYKMSQQFFTRLQFVTVMMKTNTFHKNHFQQFSVNVLKYWFSHNAFGVLSTRPESIQYVILITIYLRLITLCHTHTPHPPPPHTHTHPQPHPPSSFLMPANHRPLITHITIVLMPVPEKAGPNKRSAPQ